MKKSIKIDEKEVHDLKIRFTNLQDANANLKAELSSSNLLKKIEPKDGIAAFSVANISNINCCYSTCSIIKL